LEIVQIVALALIATFFAVLLREQNPVYAMFVGTVAGVIIFLRLMGYLAGVFQFLTEVTLQANISMVYLNTLLKIMGIAYLAEFGSQICRDAGEGVIAGKVEFAGKLLILVMALPLLAAVLETILNFVP
jgi:stage III sporulation protein AD